MSTLSLRLPLHSRWILTLALERKRPVPRPTRRRPPVRSLPEHVFADVRYSRQEVGA